jgi:RecA/RadA recombinase
MSALHPDQIEAAMAKLKEEMEVLQEKMQPNSTNLTEDQLQRIRENKKRALERKKQVESTRKKQKVSTSTSSSEVKPFQRDVGENPISTLVEDLDTLLQGGVGASDFVEINGPSSSGKTQLVHQLLASVVVRSSTERCVLLDTSGGFRPKRIVDICRGKLVNFVGDTKTLLDRIQYASVHRSDQLNALVDMIKESKSEALPRLVVVDSIIKLSRCVDSNQRLEEKNLLQSVMMSLRELSKRGVSVVVKNEVTADFSAPAGSSKGFKPAGGKQITSFLTARFQLNTKRNGSSFRKISRLAADLSVEEDFLFEICEDGVVGIER